MTYPSEYYYPEFLDKHSDDPPLLPSEPPPLSTSEYYYSEFLENHSDDPPLGPQLLSPSVTTSKTGEKLTNLTNKPFINNLATEVITDHGLPDVRITEASKTDPQKSLLRDPSERNTTRLVVNDNIIQQTIHSSRLPTINYNIGTRKLSNDHRIEDLSNRTKKQSQHQIVNVIEDEQQHQPIDEYWKKELLIDDQGVVAIEPVIYDKSTYEGPFGLTRKGSFIFYIGMSIFTLLAAVFLIMTGVFYGQNYPDSSSNTGELVGIGICAFSFYLGLQLILIGLWHQKSRQENPTKNFRKKSQVHSDSNDYLKTSMEDNEQSNYQPPMDYTPYEYYSNSPYTSNINEQMLLQQPGGATGAGHYDSVVWPSNVHIETQIDSKFLKPMNYSSEQEQQSVGDEASTSVNTSISNTKFIRKSRRYPINPVEAKPSVGDFDDIQLNSNVIEQPLPVLPDAPTTTELINFNAQMELTNDKSATDSDVSPRKHHHTQPNDTTTDVSTSSHHHHRRHRSHHHQHGRHHDHHHHQRHHHRRQHSHSPCSQCTYHSHDFHHDHTVGHQHHGHTYGHQHHGHTHGHPHHYPSVEFPRIVTPRLPRIITPHVPKPNTKVYRETGMNTGNETKIMRDSSVTADLDDIPITNDNRLEHIPIVRRTIIVEPYPAQPSSQIVVKPHSNMIGKIRLGKNLQLNNDNETIIHPSTAYLPKKKLKKKKKSTRINNHMIEDLKLEDINDDDGDQSINLTNHTTSTRKTIKNAFYN